MVGICWVTMVMMMMTMMMMIMRLQQSLKRRVGIKGGALGRGSGINPTLGLPQMVPTLGFNRNATMVHGA